MLNDEATLQAFGDLVGTSKQAIHKHVSSGVLKHGDTLGQWLIAYTDKLREEASGRAPSSIKERLDEAKTREALANAASKELALYKEQELIFVKEQIVPAMEDWIALAKSEFTSSITKIIGMLESQHNIKIDQTKISGIVDSATRVIGDFQLQSISAD